MLVWPWDVDRVPGTLDPHRFHSQVLKGMAGIPTDECAYVASTVTDLPYFSSKAGAPWNGRLVGFLDS